MARKSQVYIIPTVNGLKYLMINFLLFIISLSFANNMTLIVTFVMISYFVIQMLETHKIIQELPFSHLILEDQYADIPFSFKVHFQNVIADAKDVHAELIKDELSITASSKNIQSQTLSYTSAPLTRGHYKFHRVKFFTKGTTKLFYVWRYFSADSNVYIYPSKKIHELPKTHDDNNIALSGDMDFQEFRKYQFGQPSHRIDWKIYAKTHELFTKEFQFHDHQTLKLNYANLPGDKEEKLHFLSYLVNQCFSKGIKWSLNLPNTYLPAQLSKKHFNKSMRALSVI